MNLIEARRCTWHYGSLISHLIASVLTCTSQLQRSIHTIIICLFGGCSQSKCSYLGQYRFPLSSGQVLLHASGKRSCANAGRSYASRAHVDLSADGHEGPGYAPRTLCASALKPGLRYRTRPASTAGEWLKGKRERERRLMCTHAVDGKGKK
jgi:hypothetical protein